MSHLISITDLARKFKCAPSTISRALNDHPMINIDTRKTIQEYALKIGYQKNTLSLSLLNNCSMTLGVILPTIIHFHESTIVEGMEEVLQPKGYLLNICVSNESYYLEKEYILRLLANRVDAICISLAQETCDQKLYDHIDQAIARSSPIIFMDRHYYQNNLDRVITDDYHGSFMATEHLILNGCKKIAHLHGPQGITVSHQRFKGFADCLAQYNLPLQEEFVQLVTFSPESAIEATKALMNLENRPDGIFGVNDEVCLAAMQVIRDFNIQIPNEIALVGFDDIPLAKFGFPPLSSVSRQSKKIGQETANLFLSKLSGVDKPQQITLKPKLIVRESSSKNA